MLSTTALPILRFSNQQIEVLFDNYKLIPSTDIKSDPNPQNNNPFPLYDALRFANSVSTMLNDDNTEEMTQIINNHPRADHDAAVESQFTNSINIKYVKNIITALDNRCVVLAFFNKDSSDRICEFNKKIYEEETCIGFNAIMKDKEYYFIPAMYVNEIQAQCYQIKVFRTHDACQVPMDKAAIEEGTKFEDKTHRLYRTAYTLYCEGIANQKPYHESFRTDTIARLSNAYAKDHDEFFSGITTTPQFTKTEELDSKTTDFTLTTTAKITSALKKTQNIAHKDVSKAVGTAACNIAKARVQQLKDLHGLHQRKKENRLLTKIHHKITIRPEHSCAANATKALDALAEYQNSIEFDDIGAKLKQSSADSKAMVIKALCSASTTILNFCIVKQLPILYYSYCITQLIERSAREYERACDEADYKFQQAYIEEIARIEREKDEKAALLQEKDDVAAINIAERDPNTLKEVIIATCDEILNTKVKKYLKTFLTKKSQVPPMKSNTGKPTTSKIANNQPIHKRPNTTNHRSQQKSNYTSTHGIRKSAPYHLNDSGQRQTTHNRRPITRKSSTHIANSTSTTPHAQHAQHAQHQQETQPRTTTPSRSGSRHSTDQGRNANASTKSSVNKSHSTQDHSTAHAPTRMTTRALSRQQAGGTAAVRDPSRTRTLTEKSENTAKRPGRPARK